MLIKIQNQTYFYIHVPRTSGTNVEIQVCKKYYPEINWPHCGPYNYISKLLFGQYKDQQGRWHCATHFTKNEINNLLEELFINIDYYFTIIRNPIDRAASLYRFWKFESEKLFLDYLYTIDVDDIFYMGIKCDKLNPKINIDHRTYHFLSQYAYLYPFNQIKIFKLNEVQQINNILNTKIQYFINKQKTNRILNLKLFNIDTIKHLLKIYSKDFGQFGYPTKYEDKSPF